MTLLLDLGNYRLKAALALPAGQLQRLGEARHQETGMAAALAAVLGATVPAGGARVLCANVAGEAAGRALAAGLVERGWSEPEFLRARREACGVRCAYPEPAHLGADRWAALLGARGLTDDACLVVDAGTALTIDAMAPGGRHLGGWIVPGLTMMEEALAARTGNLAALRRASADATPAGFPTDTAPAMRGGAQLAASGAVRIGLARLDACCGTPARLFLTGGDAAGLEELPSRAEWVPELVLRGLARAAGE